MPNDPNTPPRRAIRLKAYVQTGAVIAVLIAAAILARSLLDGNGAETPAPAATPIPAGSAVNWQPVVQEIGGIPVVRVPSGCFMMGSADGGGDETPVHRVCLSAFWIGQKELTNAQYRRCVEAGACDPPGYTMYYADSAYAGDPVVSVLWSQARQYAAWLSETTGLAWSLPTEAQWEYAARGPEGRDYPWGDGDPTCDRVHIGGCEAHAAPVGPDQRASGASWVGALDLSGNMWEWVADWYGAEYYGTLADGVWDPVGPAAGDNRVVRGGSWHSNLNWARGASRYHGNPDSSSFDLGFRVVVAAPVP